MSVGVGKAEHETKVRDKQLRAAEEIEPHAEARLSRLAIEHACVVDPASGGVGLAAALVGDWAARGEAAYGAVDVEAATSQVLYLVVS